MNLSLIVGVAMVAGALVAPAVNAASRVVTIGDDDGFGETQGAKSTPGQSFAVFASPSIGPGSYSGASATDVTTTAPWSPYSFAFTFNWDTVGLTSLDSAVVQVQSGSLGRRSDGSGFGFAKVSVSTGGSFTLLGNFWSTNTGSAASSLEESVKLHTFDVKSYVSANSTGKLTLLIDGSTLAAPVDQFALDFARLTVTQVPEVPTAPMLVVGGLALLAIRRIGQRNA